MRVLDRYLVREMAGGLIAVAIVLLLVLLTASLTDVVSKVARGKIPVILLTSQMALRSIQALNIVLPLAAFLGVLLTLSRLYRDGEIAVMFLSGMSQRELLRPVLLLALPVLALALLIAFQTAPWAARLSALSLENAARMVAIAGLEPGRFVSLPDGRTVIFVEEMSADSLSFQRAFVVTRRDGREDILIAESGRQDLDEETGERFLRLTGGFRGEGEPGKGDFKLMRFAQNDVRLPDPQLAEIGDELVSTPSSRLPDSPAGRAEWHGRWFSPIAALVLMLLAVPLARSRPREARVGKLMLALALYVGYTNLGALGKIWLGQERLPPYLGLWWLHLLVLLGAFWMLWWSDRGSKPVTGPAARPTA